LGCGQGNVSRWLAQQGARVVGVDLSAGLLEIAQQDERERPLNITYLQDDAETLTALADNTFDGLICNLALMDMVNLYAVFASVWRVLKSGGWFIFSLTHPCFQAPHAHWQHLEDGTINRVVSHYFAEGFWQSDNPQGVRGQVGAYHRTLATYLNTLFATGFHFERMIEPQADAGIAEHLSGYMSIPAFMIVCARKLENVSQ
jgi:ubiquinone/menaquinone biosynthesis C-methylase UbiE